jgi:hypothetical protein
MTENLRTNTRSQDLYGTPYSALLLLAGLSLSTRFALLTRAQPHWLTISSPQYLAEPSRLLCGAANSPRSRMSRLIRSRALWTNPQPQLQRLYQQQGARTSIRPQRRGLIEDRQRHRHRERKDLIKGRQHHRHKERKDLIKGRQHHRRKQRKELQRHQHHRHRERKLHSSMP